MEYYQPIVRSSLLVLIYLVFFSVIHNMSLNLCNHSLVNAQMTEDT